MRPESHFQPSHDLEFHRRGPHQGRAAEWIEATGQKSIQFGMHLNLVDPIELVPTGSSVVMILVSGLLIRSNELYSVVVFPNQAP